MQLPQRLDTLIAYKMIAITPDLSGAERRVAAAIIDHFNRGDGRCDPSVERLATLLRVSSRTVIRSLETLDEKDLISRDRNGGRSLRNSYEPNWAKFRELEQEWKVRFNENRAVSQVTTLSAKPCQRSHLPGDAGVTQTFTENPSREPVRGGPTSGGIDRRRGGSVAKGQAGQDIAAPLVTARNPRWPQHLPQMHMKYPGAIAAERRWHGDLLSALSADDYVRFIPTITDQIRTKATAAELRQRGGGLGYLLDVSGSIVSLQQPRAIAESLRAGSETPAVGGARDRNENRISPRRPSPEGRAIVRGR